MILQRVQQFSSFGFWLGTIILIVYMIRIFLQIVLTKKENIRINGENYLEKYMDHINNGPYQVLKKYATTKIKASTLKQLKGLNDNECIGKIFFYYLKPT